jgi:hypothetical protein
MEVKDSNVSFSANLNDEAKDKKSKPIEYTEIYAWGGNLILSTEWLTLFR